MNESLVTKIGESTTNPSAMPVETDAVGWSPLEVLRWAYGEYNDKVAIASAFGAEGMVLIDMAAEVRPQPRVFVLDTSFLFPETYRLIEQVELRYGIAVERTAPALSADAQDKSHGRELWNRDPNLCCQLRKIDPLKRQLATLRAWITSIRRDQTRERAHARKVAWDSRFRLLKINPLADWSRERVWQYIRERKLLYNPLHDRNYPSIGCIHCTRPIAPGEDPRAGRWPGFQKTECGLHASVEPISLR